MEKNGRSQTESQTETQTESQLEDDGRDKWSGNLDFLLSCVGYAVSITNIWRFPYLCYKNGGGAFLIPYVIFLLICVLPIVFIEYALGQFSSSSVLTVWKISPLLKGIGYGTLIASGIYCTYVNVIISWVLYFLYQSFTSVLPWSHCNNDWNTINCQDTHSSSGIQNGTVYNSSFGIQNGTAYNSSYGIQNGTVTTNATKKTASEEFWTHKVLQITDGIENIGGIRLELLMCLFVAWIIVFLCLCKGIKSSGKVVYVTVIFPYVVLLIFLVRAVTLPGAIDGIKFMFIPKWHKLLSSQVWGEAALQIFFSTAVGWGGYITFASFNRFHHNLYREAILVPFINGGTSILAGFIAFCILGYMAHIKEMHVADVVDQGPGLAFVAYPEAISTFPVSPLWAVLFFLMMLTLGIDTQFGTIETMHSALVDEYPKLLRNRKTLFMGAICCVGFLSGMPYVMNGGIYILQTVDWYVGLISPMIAAIMECILIGWIYGTEQFYDDLEMMTGKRPSWLWGICWKFITPTSVVLMIVFNMIQFTPVSYGTYTYPSWAVGAGWIIGFASVIPIPLYIMKDLWSAEGTILQRIKTRLTSESDYGPALEVNCIKPVELLQLTTTERLDNDSSNQPDVTHFAGKNGTTAENPDPIPALLHTDEQVKRFERKRNAPTPSRKPINISKKDIKSAAEDLFESCISDRAIVEQSGFLDYINPGDFVLPDRELTIEDLLLRRQASLNIPPFLGKRTNFTSQEELKTRRMAKARIHVEHVIERMNLTYN
ncbi:Sodium- and chloride-dependent neutral and basic amino acid transporter B(0+),Sodium- and chloride-dependent taurine transporter,Sodium-dependent noradrenaline transporter,Sodium-dependent proline transporter,Sodium-and chloride-dependent glycine transporter 1,Sodium-dependent neutral amino acid transporter SLC6A17,Sodium- and chloride-dependent GABA transporter 3,Sodium- and chloride-dependent betaine transporter,Sodium-dependent dopamine transporter,Sodium-and chloride-dependent GABA transporter 1,Sodium|uniref:Transporter n=1 Tax=Mytilus coruscus TaxID=42192 RepID=A0A6J8A5W5_MYTCO|nr:Sodium- and chloride-dependent neutral and basic amino acid transporter B(0+),Sodium- and chloride-dependent taurine transporter,Sodium-dependent noradrenaline transporter,Sodium-dependent proline transporter,Sodium-and chloride-dependent glycine transporter 1,Sodium-dependent neutral amino acid transporter SLC6A17,Sodium- and chloride-dependent GABA transporter 3,Sodium- and chloride-dependent betaine transporter,Sodium-dependent dopamine transporter,Sodium-and chloride-dependent GABA transport